MTFIICLHYSLLKVKGSIVLTSVPSVMVHLFVGACPLPFKELRNIKMIL